MVHLVDHSYRGTNHYRGLNFELAKENNELKQRLARVMYENNSMSECLLQKNERISLLESTLRTIAKKASSKISPKDPPNRSRSAIRRRNTSANQVSPSLERISESAEEDQLAPAYDDSLEPPEVTSVPPIDNIGRVVHTPSVWHCLDSIEDEPEHEDSTISSSSTKDNSAEKQHLRVSTSFNLASPIQLIGRNNHIDMFQSTPVQTKTKKHADNQENLVLQPRNGKKKELQLDRETDAKRETDEPPRYNLRKRTRVCY